MMTTFSATLHHRLHKTQRMVSIFPESGGLQIHSEGESTFWLADQLSAARKYDDGSVILQHGDYFLEVTDPVFPMALERAWSNPRLFRRRFFDKIGVAGILMVLLIIVLPLIAAYIWLVPLAVERASLNISRPLEQKIGDSWYAAVTAESPVDSLNSRLVQQFYDTLGYGGDFPVRISVIDQFNGDSSNAFAIPGGHIVVCKGLLDKIATPEQLAALLAHESSHVQSRHALRALFREYSNQLIFSVLFGDYGAATTVVAQNSKQLAGLSYSRKLEQEADEQALELMKKSHIPLHGLPDLFRTLADASGSRTDVPAFLSTHPAIRDRIALAEKRIEEAGDGTERVEEAVRRIWLEIARGRAD